MQSIHKEGNINPNECIYCLNRLTVYFDEHACPVMIQQRMRREDERIPGHKGKTHLTELVEQVESAKN